MNHCKTLASIIICCLMALSALSDTIDRKIRINGSMGELAVRVQLPDCEPAGKIPVVVLCHGFMGNMGGELFDDITEDLLADTIGVVRFDFNGHGESAGKFSEMTVPNEIEDAKAVISWVGDQSFTKNISLLGHSQGGVVAAMTAGELGYPRIRALVLLAPAAVLRDDALRGFTMGAAYDPWNAPDSVPMPNGKGLGRNYIETARDLQIYPTASRYSGPAYVIHGMGDRVVPYTYGETFVREMPEARLKLIEGEDHVFSKDTRGAARAAADWLDAILNEK